MAMIRVVALMLLAMLAISVLEFTQVMAVETQHLSNKAKNRYGPGSLRSYQCPSQCSRRCKKSDHHKKACLFFCQKCCSKCLCVPPGYSGNKGVCPCYNNWKTKEGGPKCP